LARSNGEDRRAKEGNVADMSRWGKLLDGIFCYIDTELLIIEHSSKDDGREFPYSNLRINVELSAGRKRCIGKPDK